MAPETAILAQSSRHPQRGQREGGRETATGINGHFPFLFLWNVSSSGALLGIGLIEGHCLGWSSATETTPTLSLQSTNTHTHTNTHTRSLNCRAVLCTLTTIQHKGQDSPYLTSSFPLYINHSVRLFDLYCTHPTWPLLVLVGRTPLATPDLTGLEPRHSR